MVPPRKYSDPNPYRYLRSRVPARQWVASPRLRWWLLAVALAFYAVQFVGGDRGVRRRMELSAELNEVRSGNARLRLQKERLLQEVQLKENDTFSLEKLAREKYWMVGPDELIYRFEDDEVVPDVEVDGRGVGRVVLLPDEDE